MNLYVGLTDSEWYRFLSESQPDEVNFWRPKDVRTSRTLTPGEPFLFKLHSPRNYIAGGGFFVRHTVLPLSIVWEVFETKNGAATSSEFAASINKYRDPSGKHDPDPMVGCIVLTRPFFLPESEWIPVPSDFGKFTVQGKTYTTHEPAGAGLWEQVKQAMAATDMAPEMIGLDRPADSSELYRYAEQFVRQRLGQGGFRVLVTEAYHRQCAMTGERTLPVLQAAHIRPYSDQGPHKVENGLLLRSDLHILLDKGFLTVTPDYDIEVSKRIKREYHNGRNYYALHGKRLTVLPERQIDCPSREFIDWHNNNVFAA